VKVQTLCILCNNWCLFRLGYLTPVWLGVALNTVLGRVSSPGQTDRLHANRDRSSLVIESIIYDNNNYIVSILRDLFFINLVETDQQEVYTSRHPDSHG